MEPIEQKWKQPQLNETIQHKQVKPQTTQKIQNNPNKTVSLAYQTKRKENQVDASK